jgi:hypothetical protein
MHTHDQPQAATPTEERSSTHVEQFPIGTLIRYKPGIGTYGYEHLLQGDGRARGRVLGHTAIRVRCVFPWPGGGQTVRAVDPASLIHDEAGR